jgi:hypothetical protein
VSEHKLDIDVQEVARAVEQIRKACAIIEKVFEQALIQENGNDREHITTD